MHDVAILPLEAIVQSSGRLCPQRVEVLLGRGGGVRAVEGPWPDDLAEGLGLALVGGKAGFEVLPQVGGWLSFEVALA